MSTNHNEEHVSAVKAGNNNMMAIFAYLWILIIVLFLTDSKNDPFVKYHLKQGLALVIFEIVGWIAGWVLVFIHVIGWLIMWVWVLPSLVLALIGIINVLNGQEKELPLVGKF